MDFDIPEPTRDLLARVRAMVDEHVIPAEAEVLGPGPSGDEPLVLALRARVKAAGLWGPQIPRELGCSGSTAHERFTAWARVGVFDRLHAELLRRLNAVGRIDWSAGIIDSTHIRALKGGI